MPAKNRYHRQVVRALETDGWTITHDPFHLKWGMRDLYVDLGAEKLLAAEKDERRIAVEIQSFAAVSPVEDLRNALGQYTLYHDVLARLYPDRVLYLAIPGVSYDYLFQEPISQLLLENGRFRLLVFDPQAEVIQQWIG
jgi:hypothetical protein